VIDTPASCFGGPGLKSQPRLAILTGFLWFSSVPLGKCQDVTLN
jgi:hypothetical protein